MRIDTSTVAVVTGGSSGIGLGLAEELGSRGARIVVADIREDSLAPAVAGLRATGIDAIGVRVDVTDRADVERLAVRAVAEFGSVDLLCGNAGVVPPAAPLWEQTEETWRRLIDVKILGVVHGVAVFAPRFLEQGRGHFLITASSGGLAPLPGRTPYTTTMHAVVGLTETLDLELREHGPAFGATVLCPGLVDTPLGQNSAALGVLPPSRGPAPSIRSVGDALSPREVAAAAVNALEAGRVHVAPGAGVLDRARLRIQSLLEDLDPVHLADHS
ncbi:SDR family NAD(P)-dependent oxidoreductase [Rathayibacter festucae]|uniref:SDR family NAD(P)-dependent oxidoreductase n=1 Tax=Rathayibacter festucae TaxID=110937 RepID=UPI002A6A508A|nr:SDR family NAD(P)-dependent oxidoreductase [Rathayibacter festucae]MDY0914564.1 SDR family NAD(P)-dependent oxidoreductase [Rathayibacter festucae]